MDGGTLVAIVSVLTTGVLAPLVASHASMKRQREARSHAARKRREEQLKEAASEISRRWFAFLDIYRAWGAGVDPRSVEAQDAIRQFQVARADLNAILGPISVSFGPDSKVAELFRQYMSLGGVFDSFIRKYEAGEPFGPEVEREFIEEIEAPRKSQRNAFFQACFEYLDEQSP